MRADDVTIRGINRQINSPDNLSGFCTELINLREQDGIKVVSGKEVVSANLPYHTVRIHKIGKENNYIGFLSGVGELYLVHFNPDSGDAIQIIKTFPSTSEVYYTFLNNMIVISDVTAIKEYVWQFKDGIYNEFHSGIDVDINYSFTRTFYSDWYRDNVAMRSKEEFLSGAQALVNKVRYENPTYTEGFFLVAFNVTLWDGSEYGMFGLQGLSTRWTVPPTDGNAFLDASQGLDQDVYMKLTVRSDRFFEKFDMTVVESDMYNRYKDVIKSVNMYVSKPISKFVLEPERLTTNSSIVFGSNPVATNLGEIYLSNITIGESNLESTLMYKQKTWSLKEFCSGVQHTLTFGGDDQTTGATMEVYASDMERAGKMYTYNKRVHFYDSKVRLKPLSFNLYNKNEESTDFTVDVYVYISVDGPDNVFKWSGVPMAGILGENDEMQALLPPVITYSDSRAYRMVIVRYNSFLGDDTIIDISLSSSPAYNYAYAYGEKYSGNFEYEFFSPPTLLSTYQETNVVNVTANSNPVFFPVEHSYLFDGNITALSVATEDISPTQVGQYPLYVFTDSGIYALAQGSGAVLYSNIVPIKGDVCEGDVVYTRNGIVYKSGESIYLLVGKNSTKLTLLLEGEPDLYIQNNESFLKCCGGELYDITPYLSFVDFREYAQGCTFCWSDDSNELIISNTNYMYSYVYNFVSNSWYKVSGVFEGVDSSLVLRPVEINTQGATPSTGVISIPAIHSEAAKTFSYLCTASFNTEFTCAAGHSIALVIDNKQISSATFSQTTYAPFIVSTLCERIGYLEDYDGQIYSNVTLSGQTASIYDVTSGVTLDSFVFNEATGVANIGNKAVGASVHVIISNITFSTTLNEGSSVITVIGSLVDAINANTTVGVSAVADYNRIILTSKATGSETNNITIFASTTDPYYIYTSTSGLTMSGGKDVSLVPSIYREIVDWSKEDNQTNTTIHLHTRPMPLGSPDVYKTIKRAILNCRTELSGIQNLSLYIYASNNLIDWKCVAASQRKDVSISQITTDRIAKSYKHFIIMIGGIVNYKTQIGTTILNIEDFINKKLR